MRYLTDTHALIWWWDERERLPVQVLDILRDRSNSIHVSAATGWEMAIKVRKGQLPQMRERIADYHQDVVNDGFTHIAIDHHQGIASALLVGRHRDPFDRVIAAQALSDDLVVLTGDRAFAAFGCKTLW